MESARASLEATTAQEMAAASTRAVRVLAVPMSAEDDDEPMPGESIASKFWGDTRPSSGPSSVPASPSSAHSSINSTAASVNGQVCVAMFGGITGNPVEDQYVAQMKEMKRLLEEAGRSPKDKQEYIKSIRNVIQEIEKLGFVDKAVAQQKLVAAGIDDNVRVQMERDWSQLQGPHQRHSRYTRAEGRLMGDAKEMVLGPGRRSGEIPVGKAAAVQQKLQELKDDAKVEDLQSSPRLAEIKHLLQGDGRLLASAVEALPTPTAESLKRKAPKLGALLLSGGSPPHQDLASELCGAIHAAQHKEVEKTFEAMNDAMLTLKRQRVPTMFPPLLQGADASKAPARQLP